MKKNKGVNEQGWKFEEYIIKDSFRNYNLYDFIYYDDVVVTRNKNNSYEIIKANMGDTFFKKVGKDAGIKEISITNYLDREITTIFIDYIGSEKQ